MKIKQLSVFALLTLFCGVNLQAEEWYEVSDRCRDLKVHSDHWKKNWPNYDIVYPKRGEEYLQKCKADIDVRYTSPAQSNMDDGGKLKGDGFAKKHEAQNLINEAPLLKNEGLGLVREGQAIKSKGEKMFDTGEVDQAKPFITEGNRRTAEGNKKVEDADRATGRAKQLNEEGDRLIVQGDEKINKWKPELDKALALKTAAANYRVG